MLSTPYRVGCRDAGNVAGLGLVESSSYSMHVRGKLSSILSYLILWSILRYAKSRLRRLVVSLQAALSM